MMRGSYLYCARARNVRRLAAWLGNPRAYRDDVRKVRQWLLTQT
jgi:hypothetical protein